jgi:hypothetical protein
MDGDAASTYLCCISAQARRVKVLLAKSTLSLQLGELGLFGQNLLLARFEG